MNTQNEIIKKSNNPKQQTNSNEKEQQIKNKSRPEHIYKSISISNLLVEQRRINSLKTANNTHHHDSLGQNYLIKQYTKLQQIEQKTNNINLSERYKRIIDIKNKIIHLRNRKILISPIKQPNIVKSFIQLKKIKKMKNQIIKLNQNIQQKTKKYNKMKKIINQYNQKYQSKLQSLKQRPSLIKVLNIKLQYQLEKTKQIYQEIQFIKIILCGMKKYFLYKLAEILFNTSARNIFIIIENMRISEIKNDQEIGVCLGYIGLLITIVGKICNARMWIKFAFKGAKSTIRLSDGYVAILNPRDNRFNQALKEISQQLYQIMRYSMRISTVQPNSNLYQLCEQLCKQMMG